MQAQAGTRKDDFPLVELLAKRREGARAVRRTLRREGDAQLRLGHFHIRRAGQGRLEQSSAFLFGPSVMRAYQAKQIALGLVSHHLDQAGEVFSFRSQFDHRLFADRLDGNPAGHSGAAFLQIQYPLPGSPDFLAQLALRGFEPTHRAALLLQIGQRLQTIFCLESIQVSAGLMELAIQGRPGRVGNLARRIVGDGGVFN